MNTGEPSATQSKEELVAEFAAYKAKTKEWQSKIRERDAKMRTQLQQQVAFAQEKSEEARTLATKLQDVEHDVARASALEHDLAHAVQEHRNEIQAITAEYEEKIEIKQHDIVRLRAHICDLEQSLTRVQGNLDGTAFLQDDPRVVKRVCHHGIEYALLENHDTKRAWFVSQDLPANVQSKLQHVPTDEESENQRRQTAVQAAEAEVKSMEVQMAARLEQQLECNAAKVREEFERLLEGERKKFEILSREFEAEKQKHVLAEGEAKAQVQHALSQAKSEVEAQFHDKLEKLEAQLAAAQQQLQTVSVDYDNYKHRALLAMKKMKDAAGADTQGDKSLVFVQQLTSDLQREAEARESAESALEAANVTHRTALDEAMQEIRRLNSERQQHANETSALQRTIDQLTTELRNVSQTTCQRVHHSVAIQAELLQAPSERHIERSEHMTDTAKPPPEERFNFDAFLGSGGTPAPRVHDNSEGSKQHLETIEQLRLEVRNLAVSETRHIRQETLLKEQLREVERRSQREQTQAEQADYVKNVFMKFATAQKSPHVQRSLVPVMSTVLQLSPEEKRALEAALV